MGLEFTFLKNLSRHKGGKSLLLGLQGFGVQGLRSRFEV